MKNEYIPRYMNEVDGDKKRRMYVVAQVPDRVIEKRSFC